MPTYSKKIDTALAVHYKDLLKEENCTFSIPQYTLFCAKSKDWQVTFYKSGKVLVQGKNIDYIVQKYFENSYTSSQADNINENGEIAPYPHIGIDESGKGDFFGPLVIAGCYLTDAQAAKMKELGAMDSKKLDDKKILALSDIIKENSKFEIIAIGNKKYNELYSKIKNLNKLLAWGHATVLENLLVKTNSKIAISDKFGNETFIQNALKEKGREIKLIQQTKAESDTAVACASILARAEFVNKMVNLSCKYEKNFPKGAGNNVLAFGREFVNIYGKEELLNVAKAHFKTYENIVFAQNSLF